MADTTNTAGKAEGGDRDTPRFDIRSTDTTNTAEAGAQVKTELTAKIRPRTVAPLGPRDGETNGSRGLGRKVARDRRRFLTWNLEKMQMDRLPDILGMMGLGDTVLVAFQEVNMEAGIHYLKAGAVADQWIIVAGKQPGDGGQTHPGHSGATGQRTGSLRGHP